MNKMKKQMYIGLLASIIILHSCQSSKKTCTYNCSVDTISELQYSIPVIKAHLTSNPKDLMAYYSLGMSYYKLMQLDTAILYFDTLISLKPDFNGAYSNRGLCKLFLEDQKGACLDFEKSVFYGQNPRMLSDSTLTEYLSVHCNPLF